MTPNTTITAEILAGLTKCPFCLESIDSKSTSSVAFRCWTVLEVGLNPTMHQSNRCLTKEAKLLRARVKELEEAGDNMARYLTNGPYSKDPETQVFERKLRVEVWHQAKKGTK